MYRLSLSKPGAALPYLIIYSRPAGRYDRQEYAPLGGSLEMLRGDFCGGGSVQLSAPPPFIAGDWLRVWLPGDEADDPSYLGEIGGEPWQEGAGELQLRPLSDTVNKAKWSGAQESRFAEFLAYAIGQCVLPPGVTIGAIPADLATLKANTAFELLGDTLQAAMPVIEGGTSGTDTRARIGVYRPDATLTHRFVLGQAALTPGDTNNYANCVRFPFKQPDGTDAWFEGRIESEVTVRGEVWEVTQVPASVTDAAENPLEGLNAGVSIGAAIGGQAHPAVTTLPVFDPMWANTLSSPTPPQWTFSAGENFTPATADQSITTLLMGTGASGAEVHLAVTADLHGQTLASALQVRGRSDANWGSWIGATVQSGKVVTGFADVQLRYNPAHVAAYHPVGLRIDQGGYLQLYDGSGNPFTPQTGAWPGGSLPADVPVRDAAGAWSAVRVGLEPIQTPTTPAQNSTTAVAAATITPTYINTVTLPAPVLLQAGAAILVRDTNATVGTGVTGVKLITATGDIALTPADAEDDMTKWTFPGPDKQVWGFRVLGNPANIGRIIARLTSTANLAAYAYGLLRYRTQPVRSWVGTYKKLRRVSCSGVARFETLNGEVDLDVQRVTYNLTDGTVSVEAGTPQARTDAEALAAAIQDVRQETRKATGG
ncbi:hypothetical protein DKM44_02350 [Deinococcus irradiatisoli]|uniref:Uncharacterized protein n=1 Tax=Deinococcus irradiatisoli TaxID=2202254 RepID=A0A2Z3JJW4_9DEIO|nr:hypothetical protein [Deinococcus irradiatisoli]AWN22218.1 hypothetical protein DKM44_02350 [Deinococcus irradiatisoli]